MHHHVHRRAGLGREARGEQVLRLLRGQGVGGVVVGEPAAEVYRRRDQRGHGDQPGYQHDAAVNVTPAGQPR